MVCDGILLDGECNGLWPTLPGMKNIKDDSTISKDTSGIAPLCQSAGANWKLHSTSRAPAGICPITMAGAAWMDSAICPLKVGAR